MAVQYASPSPGHHSMRGCARSSGQRSNLRPWRCASRSRPMAKPSDSACLSTGRSAWRGRATRSIAPRGHSTRWNPTTVWWPGPWSVHGKRPSRARSGSPQTIAVCSPRNRSRCLLAHARLCAASRVICRPGGTLRQRPPQTARRLFGHWASAWGCRCKGRVHMAIGRGLGAAATAPRRGACGRSPAWIHEALPRPCSPGPPPCISKACAGGRWPRGALPKGGDRPSVASPVRRIGSVPSWCDRGCARQRRGRAP